MTAPAISLPREGDAPIPATPGTEGTPPKRLYTADQLAREPSLVSRIHEMRMVQRTLADRDLAARCASILDRADAAIHKVRYVYTAYDAVWRALHEVRHLLCAHGDGEQRLQAAADILADIEYHTDKAKLREELDQIVTRLHAGEQDAALGRRLMWISMLAAEEREAAWRRTNRVLRRRLSASRVLTALCVVLIIGLPLVLDGVLVKVSAPDLAKWLIGVLNYGALVAFGALGGLLSGLLRGDREDLPSTAHHLEQLAFKIRPRIGGIAAIILDLIARTGFIKVAGAGTLGPELLLLAIAAGFSERFLIGHMDRLSAVLDGKGPPPAPKTPDPPAGETSDKQH